MNTFRKVLQCGLLLQCLILTPVLAEAATGIENLGEICIGLNIHGPNNYSNVIPLKLSILSLGTNYYPVNGLIKWDNPKYPFPTTGTATVSYDGLIAISLTASSSDVPASTLTVYMDPKTGEGHYTSIMDTRPTPHIPENLFSTTITEDTAFVMNCSEY